MPQVDLEPSLLTLKARDAGAIDLEPRVWAAIARAQIDRDTSLFNGGAWNWRLATGAIALAASAGFMAATWVPTAQAKPTQALESWTRSQAPKAPSVLLGG